jgi:hypothetical protein
MERKLKYFRECEALVSSSSFFDTMADGVTYKLYMTYVDMYNGQEFCQFIHHVKMAVKTVMWVATVFCSRILLESSKTVGRSCSNGTPVYNVWLKSSYAPRTPAP